MSSRATDDNGFISIENNPIIREGVFPYLGSSIDPAGNDPEIEPSKVYYVYRPADEIERAADTFKIIPFVDEHAMLGPSDAGYMPAEKKGVHGTTGEAVAFRGGILYSNLKIFSEALANLIKSGKKELSLGYRCQFAKQAGTFAGTAYQFIQRSLKGNHLALVDKGRNNVAVLDGLVFDHFDINIEKEKNMPTIEELLARVDAQDAAIKEVKEQNVKLQAALDESEKEEEKKAEDEDEKDDKKAEDESDEDKEKKAEDEDDKSEKDDKAMDAAVKKIDALDSELQTFKKTGIKALISEVSKRNNLVQKLGPYIGTFDHEDKTLDEVAKYGVEKLGLSCPSGHEQTALDAFLHNRPEPGHQSFAIDSAVKKGGLDAYTQKTA